MCAMNLCGSAFLCGPTECLAPIDRSVQDAARDPLAACDVKACERCPPPLGRRHAARRAARPLKLLSMPG